MTENDPELMNSDRDFTRLVRAVHHRLESLQRAGVRTLPRPTWEPPARQVEVTPEDKPASLAVEPSPARTPERPAAASPPPRPAQPPPLARSLLEEPELTAPAMPEAERAAALKALADEVAVCVKCPHLAAARTRTVFGEGNPSARLMFVGEAPGADEDRTGRPFVGRAGQLLTDMITKGMGLRREDVYIANVLKCRPPENREPSLDETTNCLPYLERQIEIIRPQFLCLLGRSAVFALLGTSLSMSKLRGKWHRYRGIPTIATYHPSYLLRTPSAKKDAWQDLQMLMNAMGIPIPGRTRRHE